MQKPSQGCIIRWCYSAWIFPVVCKLLIKASDFCLMAALTSRAWTLLMVKRLSTDIGIIYLSQRLYYVGGFGSFRLQTSQWDKYATTVTRLRYVTELEYFQLSSSLMNVSIHYLKTAKCCSIWKLVGAIIVQTKVWNICLDAALCWSIYIYFFI